MSLRKLFDHQQRAMMMLKEAISEGYRSPMMQMPTGSGKTVLAAHIVDGARRKGNKLAFCVPAISLIDQTFERFQENGIPAEDMGIIQADHPWQMPNAPIQICSVQTLARRNELPDVKIAVIDEAHIRYKVYERWMGLSDDSDAADVDGNGVLSSSDRAPIDRKSLPLFIGLSATPWTEGLGRMYDTLIKPTSLSELIELGRLSKFRVFAPTSGVKPDLSGVKTRLGDYVQGQLEDRMSDKVLVADIVSTWLTKGENRPTLCFATGVGHAKMIHDQFEDAGVPVAYIDADTPRDERAQIGKMLEAGEIKVVCNIGTLTTGIDWDVRCIILARPTKSPSLFVQIIGRGLRVVDGKTDCLILDHSDTHTRLGMVTDIDFDRLDDGRKKDKSEKEKERDLPLPRECPDCHALVPAGERICPECGFEFKPLVKIEHTEGDLVELTPGSAIRKSGGRVIDALAEIPHNVILGELLSIKEERDFKIGWVSVQYKEIYGVWPPWGYEGRTELRDPSPLLRSWITSRAIAFRRGKKKQKERASGLGV